MRLLRDVPAASVSATIQLASISKSLYRGLSVAYNSFLECQKADWKHHKRFCVAYSTLHEEIMTLDIPPDEPTHDMTILAARATERAMDKRRILEFILGRPMTTRESTLLNWEPRCLAWYMLR